MKIIAKDNFNSETVSDHLVAENVNETYAKLIVRKLNEGDLNEPFFYEAVADDYKLYKFEP